MRFINRSHREGPLGSVLGAAAQDGDDLAGGVAGYRAAGRLLEQYPLLPEVLGMSAPEATHYQPGDVTLHHGCESSLTSKLCDFARVTAYVLCNGLADMKLGGLQTAPTGR